MVHRDRQHHPEYRRIDSYRGEWDCSCVATMSKRAKGWVFIWVSLLFRAMAISTLVSGALGDPDRSDWLIWTVVIVLLSAVIVVAYIWVFRSTRALRAPDRSGR